MSNDELLANLLQQFMARAKYKDQRLATAVKARAPNNVSIHRSTIRNWRRGDSRRVEEWRQLVQIAAVLDLSQAEANQLLAAGGHLPLNQLWQQAQGNDQLLFTSWPTIAKKELQAVQVGPPPSSRLPHARNKLFVGREAEMADLTAVLTHPDPGSPPATAILSGSGGIGKSQLAVEFAYRQGHLFSGGVFWFSFMEAEDIESQIADSGDVDGMNLQLDFNSLDLSERLKLVQRAWQEAVPRLLIFDNCEEETLLNQYRPTLGGCRILVTSRRARWNPQLGVRSIQLDGLQRTNSVALLHKFRSDLTTQEADAVAVLLGDLPLALILAGSALEKTRHDITVTEFLTDLQRKEGDSILDHPFFSDTTRGYSPTGHDLNVARTFEFSYRQLQTAVSSDQHARDLLAQLAVLAPGIAIPRSLLTILFTAIHPSKLALSQAVHQLVQLGLLFEGNNGQVTIHQLIAAFVLLIHPQNEMERIQLEVEKAILIEITPHLENEEDYRLQLWEPHLWQLTIAAQKRQDVQAAEITHQFGRYLRLNGRFAASHDMFQQALTMRRQLLAKNDPQTAKSHQMVGLVHYHLSQFEIAHKILKSALKEQRTVLGTKHKVVAATLSYLGMVLQEFNNYEQAAYCFEESYTILLNTVGEQHLDTATALNNRGYLQYLLGNYNKALVDLEKATDIRIQLLNTNSRIVAEGLNNIALIYDRIGNTKQALETINQVVRIWETMLKQDHPYLGTAYSNRGYFHYRLEQFTKAQSDYEHALEIEKKTLGEQHADTIVTINNLGTLLAKMGQRAVAEPYLLQALSYWIKTNGSESIEAAHGYHNIGRLYFHNPNQSEKGRTYLEKALSIRQERLGKDHQLTQETAKVLQQIDEDSP